MRLSRFFIMRPIFAAVIAVIITLVGAIAYWSLPVSQYPDIVPPTVTVTANYPGASAETVAETVATPIEQEINGVDNMLYQSSQSTGDGTVTITVTFKIGTDLDAAQVLVQNRVAIAVPRLPEEVQRLGVVTRKTSPDFLMVVNLVSPDKSRDRSYLSNYALTQLKDRLSRIDGVGDVRLFGARDYAMRVWIDPTRAAALNLTAGEIVAALRAQNVQVAAGSLGQPPYASGNAYQLNVETQGRLVDPQQFADVVIRTDADGRQVRVADVARVELGASDYNSNTYLSGDPTVILAAFLLPAVRGDDLDRDDHLADRLADAVARARRDPAEAARRARQTLAHPRAATARRWPRRRRRSRAAAGGIDRVMANIRVSPRRRGPITDRFKIAPARDGLPPSREHTAFF